MTDILIAFLISFGVAGVICPLVMKILKKVHASQTILHYVEAHEGKQGTPTMGGIIFILGAIISSIFILKNDITLAIISLASMLGFGVLGFLDDFIKVRYKQNMGLRAYQKIIGQVGLAVLIAFFAYYSSLVGTSVIVPFTNLTIDLGWAYIPFCVFVFLAITNSVNLLDGLDGLASGVSFIYLIGFMALIYLHQLASAGQALNLITEQNNLILISACMLGALLVFLVLNAHPACVFMGDTGSLALGGFIAGLAVLSRLILYVPIIGLVYVLTALSDIIQVLHYKRTKKRIFLMAPLHHHFEKKGMHENKIVIVYIVITLLLVVLTVLGVKFALGV